MLTFFKNNSNDNVYLSEKPKNIGIKRTNIKLLNILRPLEALQSRMFEYLLQQQSPSSINMSGSVKS